MSEKNLHQLPELAFAPELSFSIVAAGAGARAGAGGPKAYRSVDGVPVLRRVLKAIRQACPDSSLFVAIRPDHEALFHHAAQGLRARFVHGGATRMLSVRACLHAMRADPPRFVLVHDAARPFVGPALIQRLLAALQDSSHDGALPFLPVRDALKKTENGQITGELNRTGLVQVQTPQVFRFSSLWRAFESWNCGDEADDEAQLARMAGLSMCLVPGEEGNKKLTWPEDFVEYQETASPLETSRTPAPAAQKIPFTTTGFGYDVHRLIAGEGIHLCGVWIACPYHLVGHSDADVGLHALTDAILGACGEGDIGDHFPPHDPRWKNASSKHFLRHALVLAEKQGAQVCHVDLTFVAETPKIKPYREAMRAFLAQILGLPLPRVSIKATTTEGLGFVGRREGLAAYGLVTLLWPG